METAPKKQVNLTNKDFKELLQSHVATKQKQPPQEEVISSIKTDKKVKTKNSKKRKVENYLEKLLLRYRDRAKERREGKNPDYLSVSDPLGGPIAYHTVAPDAQLNTMLAERRKQLIQESKYMGGDMAHTHLVKGLDLALLNKVRCEIEAKTTEVSEEVAIQEETGFKSQMARNIYEILFAAETPVKNPLFAPGRMSYMVDLMGDEISTEVPTTVIRSQIQASEENNKMKISDAVINNISQVMQGLRGECKSKKQKKVEPPLEAQEEKKERKKPEPLKVQESKVEAMYKRLMAEPTGYAECYPGQEAMMEAAGDSDLEEDEEIPSTQVSGLSGKNQKDFGNRQRKRNFKRESCRIRSRLQI